MEQCRKLNWLIYLMKMNNLQRNEKIKEIIRFYLNKYGNKQIIVINKMAIICTSLHFIESLNHFYEEDDDFGGLEGYIFSNNLDEDDEEYDGKNTITFYNYVSEKEEQVLTYKEFYEYLKIACNFYIELYPEQKKEVLDILEKIKEKYLSE